jgi:hypothetical protein
MNVDKGNVTGSGRADGSGDVESRPASGTHQIGKKNPSGPNKEYKALNTNSDTRYADHDDTGELNGMSVIMPKGE